MSSEPQASLDGRRISMLQGHVLGGGSSVNAMTYTRGVPSDYARWDEAAGGTGWDWRLCSPISGNMRAINA